MDHSKPNPQQPLTPRLDVAVDFLKWLHPGAPWVTLIAIIPDGATTARSYASPVQWCEFISAHNHDKNVYYFLNRPHAPMDKKAKKKDIAQIWYLFADCDPNKGESPEEAKARYETAEQNVPKASASLDSGGGYQYLWRLKTPLSPTPENIRRVEAISKGLMIKLGAKAGTQNIDRILRLSGTINHPNAAKLRAGRVACMATERWKNGVSYDLKDFAKYETAGGTDSADDSAQSEGHKDLNDVIKNGRYDLFPDENGEPDRSRAVWFVIHESLRQGWEKDDIAAALLDRDNIISEHVYDQGNPTKWVRDQIEKASEQQEQEATYKTARDGIYWKMPTKNGFAWVRLSSFTATITEDVKLDDGSGQIARHFIIEGNLGRAEVPAERYDGLSWVTREWGWRAVITPGHNHKEHLAVAIKTLGRAVEHNVFTHLGWRKVGNQLVYLHAGGAIGAEGPVDGVEVNHLGTLSQFGLPPVIDLRAAMRSSLALLDVAPAHIVYPLWGATFRAPLGAFAPVTVTVWLAGPSGVLKTSVALIAQAHFAPAISARSSANWTSTANANERLTFLAKDALVLVDDFAPRGTTHEVARMHATAERLIRAQANQAGRMRMNPDATLKMEMYPRCGLLGTGEDVPRGHSLRARMIVVEVGAGDVDRDKLAVLQHDAETGLPAQAMAGYLSWLARQDHSAFKQRERELRAETTGPHLRTPENIASLMLGVETGLRFAVESGALGEAESQRHQVEAWNALTRLAEGQEHFLRTEAPADRFMFLLQSVLSSGRAHATTTVGGTPHYPEGLGWRIVAWKGGGDTGEPPEPVYREQGRKLGWVDSDYLYLNPDVAYSECQELARTQNASLEVTQGTLWQRLDDAGKIAQKDADRTTRKLRTPEGRKRTICLALGDVLDLDAKPPM